MGVATPRLTHQSLRVLRMFAVDPAFLCGADILNTTNLASGTLYPILLRFENAGLLKSKWEPEKPTDLRRPRRRLYWITAKGRALAGKVFDELGV